MSTEDLRNGDRRAGRLVVTYVVVLLLGAIGLAVSLTAGDRVEAAPQLATVSTVSGPAADCLGDQLVAIQSGEYLDLHRPGEAGIDGPVGDRVLRGIVGAGSGQATLHGHCAAAGSGDRTAVVADLRIDDERATGSITVAGTTHAATLRPQSPSTGATGPEAEPLEGGALVARTFLAVAAILLMAQMVGLVFGRVRLTRVMGEIVAGILLGPSLLGAVAPSASEYLFPPQVTGALHLIGQFGLIFFMFLVGLELNRRLVRGLGHQVVLVSHVSIVMPFAIGVGLAVALYPRLGSGSFSGFALFMGAAMAITAFPVLARILSDTGLNRTPLGALAITCAAVDDLTAWCILATVIAVVSAGGAGEVASTIGLTLVYGLAMFFVVKPALRAIAWRLHDREALGDRTIPPVLVALLLSAWLTEMIGIHAIFGAFVLGVVMPRPPELKSVLQTRLEEITLVFLLPIFFAVVGLSTRIALLHRWELWLFTGAIIVAAIAGKLGGSLLAARVAGHDWRNSTALGLLMNTRGLTEIVILTIGAELGVISPALFAMMVLMALVTTLMATPLLSLVYPRARIEAEARNDPRTGRSDGRRPGPGDLDAAPGQDEVGAAGPELAATAPWEP